MEAKHKNILAWVITGLLALQFIAAGLGKVRGGMVAEFAAWGYSSTFMYIIGALEIAGAIGLFIPVLRRPAALGLAGIMVGAAYTHFLHGEYGGIGMNILVIVICLILLKLRREVPS